MDFCFRHGWKWEWCVHCINTYDICAQVFVVVLFFSCNDDMTMKKWEKINIFNKKKRDVICMSCMWMYVKCLRCPVAFVSRLDSFFFFLNGVDMCIWYSEYILRVSTFDFYLQIGMEYLFTPEMSWTRNLQHCTVSYTWIFLHVNQMGDNVLHMHCALNIHWYLQSKMASIFVFVFEFSINIYSRSKYRFTVCERIEHRMAKRKIRFNTYDTLWNAHIIGWCGWCWLIRTACIPQNGQLLYASNAAFAKTTQLNPISADRLIGRYNKIVSFACRGQQMKK